MNILLIERCSLTCPYCFFKGSLNARPAERETADLMTEEGFREALRYARELVAKGIRESVNLLGGEPTMHPGFQDFVRLALSAEYALPDGSPLPVNVFSNGIFEPELAEFLARTPCGLMFNVNAPSSYRGSQWRRLNENLDAIAARRGSEPFSLSLNLTRPDQETGYAFEIMARCGARHLRVDFAKPSADGSNDHVAFAELPAMMPLLEDLARRCSESGIRLVTDCCVPVCSVDNDMLRRLKEEGIFLSFACPGGIDVAPDLSVFYCGPLRDVSFGRITNYADASILARRIEERAQLLRWQTTSQDECESCKWRTLDICQGGCLAFRKPAERAGRRMVQ